MNRGWIGVDLDGTLAHYVPTPASEWNPFKIGDPVQPMLALVKSWLAEGFEVRIVTARVAIVIDGKDTVQNKVAHAFQCAEAIQDWLQANGLPRLLVQSQKDYNMLELYDDRAVQVEANTGRLIGYSTRERGLA